MAKWVTVMLEKHGVREKRMGLGKGERVSLLVISKIQRMHSLTTMNTGQSQADSTEPQKCMKHFSYAYLLPMMSL